MKKRYNEEQILRILAEAEKGKPVADRLRVYRGYGQFFIEVSRTPRQVSLAYSLHMGKDFTHWAHQVDLTVPMRTSYLDIETAFLIQYFNGFGESLRDYTVHSATVRAGFSLVR